MEFARRAQPRVLRCVEPFDLCELWTCYPLCSAREHRFDRPEGSMTCAFPFAISPCRRPESLFHSVASHTVLPPITVRRTLVAEFPIEIHIPKAHMKRAKQIF